MQLSGEDWFGVKNAQIYGIFIKKIAKFLKVKKCARNVHTYLKRKYLQPQQCAIVHPYSPSACFERDSGCSGWKRSSLIQPFKQVQARGGDEEADGKDGGG